MNREINMYDFQDNYGSYSIFGSGYYYVKQDKNSILYRNHKGDQIIFNNDATICYDGELDYRLGLILEEATETYQELTKNKVKILKIDKQATQEGWQNPLI